MFKKIKEYFLRKKPNYNGDNISSQKVRDGINRCSCKRGIIVCPGSKGVIHDKNPRTCAGCNGENVVT